jgi:hypothetical protein
MLDKHKAKVTFQISDDLASGRPRYKLIYGQYCQRTLGFDLY